MSATVIPFEKVVKPAEIITCSFCQKIIPEKATSLSSANGKHLCVSCMVKCDKLMKESDKNEISNEIRNN